MASTTPSNAVSSINQSFPVSNVTSGFVDRRSTSKNADGRERRQFGSSHANLSENGRELALAIDEYKVKHHRRYITCDEMLSILTELGYRKIQQPNSHS